MPRDADDPQSDADPLDEIEKDSTSLPHDRGMAFRKAVELYRASDDEEFAQVAEALWRAFSLVSTHKIDRFTKNKPRFGMTVSFEGHDPPLADAVPADARERLRDYASRTTNPATRSRICDLLWEIEEDAVAARDAITAYMAYAEELCAKTDAGLEIADALLRSLEIALRLNDPGCMDSCLQHIMGRVKEVVFFGDPRWAYELIREVLACKRVRKSLPLSEMEKLIETVLQNLEPDPPTNHWEQMWLSLLQRLAQVKDDPTHERKAKIRMAESSERAGDFWVKNDRSLQAIDKYLKAAQGYRDAGRSRDRIASALWKLEEAIKSSPSEMGTVSTPLEISGETMNEWHNEVSQLFSTYGVKILALDGYVLPDVNRLRQQMADGQETFPLQFIFRRTGLHENRIISASATVEENVRAEFVGWFVRMLFLHTGHIAAWVLGLAREQESSVQEQVMDAVSQGAIIDERRHPILRRALERYEAEDYISCVHILVFQIEGILRDFAHLLGLPVIALHPDGTTPARPLSDLLRNGDYQKLQEVLGESLLESLRAILDSKQGPNTRNEVAHGLAGMRHFQADIANVLIVFLVQLAAFRATPASGGTASPPEESAEE